MISLEQLFKAPRKSASSFSELLPWFLQVAPGLVICKDGSLLAGFEFEGSDIEGREDFEADHKIDQLQTALRTLSDRVTMWTVQERRFVTGYNHGSFSSPIAQAIDQQWERGISNHRNAKLTQRMYIGYSFPNASEAFFESLTSEIDRHDGKVLAAIGTMMKRRFSEDGAISKVRGQLSDMVMEFEKILKSFAGIVELNLGFRRLLDEHFLGELFARANLASPRGPVIASGEGAHYLDTSLAVDTLIRRNDLFEFQGPSKSIFVAALSTTGMPQDAYSGYMDSLMSADAEYVLVQCYRFIDRLVAEKAIQDAEMFYRSEVKSVLTRVFERMTDSESDKVNTGNLHLAQDAQEALVELTATTVSYGYYNLTVLALGQTQREAENAVERIAGNLRTNGFTMLRERQGLMSALLTTMPGSAGSTLRWKLASTANLADFAPIRTIEAGEPTHPFFSRLQGHPVPALVRFLTPYGVTLDFNPHEEDVGHTAVVGGTGAGKSMLVSLFVSMFQKYNPSQTFIFDMKYSLMMATVLLGGKHIDMGTRGGKSIGMNPVKTMLRVGDDNPLRQWIEVLIGAGGNPVSSRESQVIFTAIQGLRRSPESSWRLSALYALIAGVDQDLAAKLAPYVDRTDDDESSIGTYAGFFDNDEDSFELSHIVGMEVEGILREPKIASPFMDYAFYNIERRLDGTKPTMIYVEEAWYMLSNKTFVAKFETWLRTFRSKRAFIVFATQSLGEIARLENLEGIVANIPTQILLPSLKESVQQSAHLYKDVFGINDAQLGLLSRAIPKRDYLLVKPSVTRLVNTQMPPLLIAINEATTQPAMRSAVLAAAARGGPDWELNFVKEVLHVQP